ALADYVGAYEKRLSAEHKAKIGAAHKGRKFSEASRAKMSAAKKGRAHSVNHRLNISAAKRGRKGTPHTAETRARIAAAAKANWADPEHRAAHMQAITQEVRYANGSGKRGRKLGPRSADTR